ncbi:hypothetical protein DSL72_005964 [Monilinia vaccinii-corymbosi]|uniref:Amino acid permease/ SLC12A domain-containing protein n=1 Tax=Monilinia vaccinii-corymbosi TaxID=61207 RepID=A0A8A3PGH4_9HELO|nr:hypothetical protein DSL72_005964 [Monilinia vaccinii-corymbosi]
MPPTSIGRRNSSLDGISPSPSIFNSEIPTIPRRESQSQLVEVNERGNGQEVERNFSLLSICSVGLVIGNSWAALGGSIATAIYNGGPPGVLYELIAVSVFYWLIAASLAELASSIPSSAGVYQWASTTPGPKYGRICGWFAGWWNTFAWICAIVLFANRALPMINNIGLALILGGVIITVVICVVMPAGRGHATHAFVWTDWANGTGYSNNVFVFLAGMLNGAYAVGTPSGVSHLAEEIPNPKRNIPLAMGAQMIMGFITSFIYMIALFYATTDLEAVLDAPFFPLTQIYLQATRSPAAATGLLAIMFFNLFCCLIGAYITAGRCLWTLARDNAVPFSSSLQIIHPHHKSPINATIACGICGTILGAIYVGSLSAFNAFVGSFVVLITLSYLASILPFILTGRFTRSNQSPGPYNNKMVPGALSIAAGIWWLVKGGTYEGPNAGTHGQPESDATSVRDFVTTVSAGNSPDLPDAFGTEKS